MMGTTKDGRVPASLQYAAEPANASAAGSRSALGTTSSITMQSLGKIALTFCKILLGSVVVRALDLQSACRGFDSRPPPHCLVATLGKSFTHAQRLWSYDRMAL